MPVKCTESESSYMAGCRCKVCRTAHTDRERRRRENKRLAFRNENEGKKGPSRKLREIPSDNETFTRQEILRARGWD